jgi:predicted HAD superfamily Cof-like phosphohydrolase
MMSSSYLAASKKDLGVLSLQMRWSWEMKNRLKEMKQTNATHLATYLNLLAAETDVEVASAAAETDLEVASAAAETDVEVASAAAEKILSSRTYLQEYVSNKNATSSVSLTLRLLLLTFCGFRFRLALLLAAHVL